MSEPAESLTDLALGLVALCLARGIRTRDVNRYWSRMLWWAAAAALAGALHHGFVTYSDTWAGPSWAVISGMVVVTISFALAARSPTNPAAPRGTRRSLAGGGEVQLRTQRLADRSSRRGHLSAVRPDSALIGTGALLVSGRTHRAVGGVRCVPAAPDRTGGDSRR